MGSPGEPVAEGSCAMTRPRRFRPLSAVALAAIASVVTTLASTPTQAQTQPAVAPGATSHFDLARKDCLGTARTATSKVWFTVAGGVLSDTYYPTVDTTNVETLQDR